MPFSTRSMLSSRQPIRNKNAKRRLLFEAMESRCLLAYSFTSIDVPGASTSPAYGINDAGQIVGYYEAAGFHGFLKTGANFAALDATSLGATGTFAQRINNGGDIVGTYHRANHLHAFLMQNGGAYSEILVPGATDANALGINDSGQIVGNYAFPNPSGGADLQFGFVKTGNTFEVINPSSIGNGASGAITAWAINNSGDFVGGFNDASGLGHGFIKNSAGYSAIDVPGARSYTIAYGINSSGVIVGEYDDAAGREHGFVKSNTGYETVDYPGATLTRILGINTAGQIVGHYGDTSGRTHGFLGVPDISPPTTVVDTNAAMNSVTENAGNGSNVGITAFATGTSNGTVAYSLTNNAGGRFAINSSTGVVTVANGNLLDGPATHTITVQATNGSGGMSSAEFSVIVTNLVDISGRVFEDRNNDGLFNGIDVGLAGVRIEVWDQATNVLLGFTNSNADGTYFQNSNLSAGRYKIVEVVNELTDLGLLDGKETAGNLGGTVVNNQNSSTIADVVVGEPGTTADAVDYLFAEIRVSNLFGLVWEDFNDDGLVNFSERAVPNATVVLTGKDDRGNAVNVSVTTGSDGIYMFGNQRPSDVAGYTISESQPVGFVDGRDTLGTVNGLAAGQNSANDTFTGVVMTQAGSSAQNYNFGERPTANGPLASGQTASIGFWQNNNGQALINVLNGGPTSTQLGNWLSATLPNLYGTSAGVNNLIGKTNAQVGAFYTSLFTRTNKTAGVEGPPKLDAQVLATALAMYVTNGTLAGNAGTSFGFVVSTNGVGMQTFNVGSKGAAFGVANNSSVTIFDLLLAVNSRATNGVLFGGVLDKSLRISLCTMVNDVFSSINEGGHI